MSTTIGPSNKNLWLRPTVMKRELRELVKQKEKNLLKRENQSPIH